MPSLATFLKNRGNNPQSKTTIDPYVVPNGYVEPYTLPQSQPSPRTPQPGSRLNLAGGPPPQQQQQGPPQGIVGGPGAAGVDPRSGSYEVLQAPVNRRQSVIKNRSSNEEWTLISANEKQAGQQSQTASNPSNLTPVLSNNSSFNPNNNPYVSVNSASAALSSFPQSPVQPTALGSRSNSTPNAVLTKRPHNASQHSNQAVNILSGGTQRSATTAAAVGNNGQLNGGYAINPRSGDGQESIHSHSEKDKDKRDGWKGIFGSSKDRDKEKEKDQQEDMMRMIGFLTARWSEDFSLVLEVCERVQNSESAAINAARALRKEFKYAEPTTQLSAARLWAIMLQNSGDFFIIQCANRRFLERLESVITSPDTLPVVKERLLNVLAGAAYTFRQPGCEGFLHSWRRMKTQGAPDNGIPFDPQDSMFDEAFPRRAGAPQPTQSPPPGHEQYYGSPPAPPSKSRSKQHGHSQHHSSYGTHGRSQPQPPPRRDKGVISEAEDIRRLFEECHVAKVNASVLTEALVNCEPGEFEVNQVIREFYPKCRASHELIAAQIPWASAGAEKSRQGKKVNKPANTPTPSINAGNQTRADEDFTTEEMLLEALLGANQELLDVFKLYEDVQNANAEENKKLRGKTEKGASRSVPRKLEAPVPIPGSKEPSPAAALAAATRAAYSRELPTPPQPPPALSESTQHAYPHPLPPPIPTVSPPPQSAPITSVTPQHYPLHQHHHSHSHSTASLNNLAVPALGHGPALGPRTPPGSLQALQNRSRSPSPERPGHARGPQYGAPRSSPPLSDGGQPFPISPPNAPTPVSATGTPTTYSAPRGPPPPQLQHRPERLESLRSLQGGPPAGIRVDVTAAQGYAASTIPSHVRTQSGSSVRTVPAASAGTNSGAAEEEIVQTPIQPSAKALGKRRADPDAQPDPEELERQEEAQVEEAMLRSQSPYVEQDVTTPLEARVRYVYDAAAERERELSQAEERERLERLRAAAHASDGNTTSGGGSGGGSSGGGSGGAGSLGGGSKA